jgi:glycosyltransferase involved in cell wall biosynthesis
MQVAIVHDHMNQMGGAERVVAALHEIFPAAPIFTTIVDWDILRPELAHADIRPSWMQKLPGWKKHFKKYLPFYPLAIESMEVKKYDLLISSSSAFAKSAKKGPNALHICYCYTPMRFAWDYHNYVKRENLNLLYRSSLPLMIAGLKRWDQQTKDRPDHYIAVSSVVKERIRRIYGKPSDIIFPPVDVQKYRPQKSTDDFYLMVSRLSAYKRIDLAVEAFNRLGLPLKIIGSGPYYKTLKSMARPNVVFLRRLPDKEVAEYYSACKALIFPGEEDFGIAPLEANASGRPVIAFKAGGALDTVKEGLNGLFFGESNVRSLMEAVKSFENGAYNFDPQKIRDHALLFDREVFKDKMKRYVSQKWTESDGGREPLEGLADGTTAE